MIDSWLAEKKIKNTEGVQETLPQGREKPAAGLQPVSRQRMETILPSEKEEGSSVETQKQLITFSLHTTLSCIPDHLKIKDGKCELSVSTK